MLSFSSRIVRLFATLQEKGELIKRRMDVLSDHTERDTQEPGEQATQEFLVGNTLYPEAIDNQNLSRVC